MGVSSILGCAFPLTVAAADEVKILTLGDSITDGYWTGGGYRKYLYHELEQKGYTNIDMVGPKGSDTEYFNYNGQSVTYDGNYAGYSGYAIQNISGTETRSGILEVIQSDYGNGNNMISAYDPDVVLLQIGTNDILSNYNDGITDRLDNLVEVILRSLDGEDDMLYVSTIPDINVAERYDWLWSYGMSYSADPEGFTAKVQGCIDAYNDSIQTLVAEKQAEGKPIAFADIHSVVDQNTDLYDGVHPNEAGYENMGNYWANLLDETYFGGSGDTTDTPTVTTPTSTTTTTTSPTVTTTSKITTTTENATTTTTNTKPVITPSDDTIVLDDVKIGETYDLTPYKESGITAISFVFNQTPPYGMNGCVAFGNWESYQNYTGEDLINNTLTFTVNKAYDSMIFNKWYGDTELESVILYCGTAAETSISETTTTTKKPTTTTTTTTSTAKPTTTTTTTTTTEKPTTTTTTTTTTTDTTTAPVTTATTTETSASEQQTAVLTDVTFGASYDLSDYDYQSITKIELKFKGNIGYGFGGALVLGNWTVQNSYGHTDMDADNTITFKVTNPQDRFTLFRYWGEIELDKMVIYFAN